MAIGNGSGTSMDRRSLVLQRRPNNDQIWNASSLLARASTHRGAPRPCRGREVDNGSRH